MKVLTRAVVSSNTSIGKCSPVFELAESVRAEENSTDLTQMLSAAAQLHILLSTIQLVRERRDCDQLTYWKKKQRLEFKGDA